ncbi:MAG TPA: phosphoribosylformylglycinamidine cyclo-ligase [bacterium]|nr:phosphoribosylformylglycinamidine cyclo-ligase [bacterium]
MKRITYRSSGVNIDKGNEAVRRIKKHVKRTFNKHVLADIGLFGGLFELDTKRYRRPVLVSSTDGVGTKTQIGVAMGRFKGLGMDIVGHSINDILVQGAKPLFFLDYIAGGKLDPAVVEQMVEGMADVCARTDLALVGGETAEMPSVYKPGDYDIAGTIVGVVEKDRVIRGRDVTPGDLCIGLPSVSLHTNGYSLARKIVKDVARVRYQDAVREVSNRPIGEVLLVPHKSYFHEIYPILDKVRVKAMAHITGGGLLENPPRVLPEGRRIRFHQGSWPIPPVFKWLVRLGNVPEEDAYRSLNMGIGMVLIVGAKDAAKAMKELKKNGGQPMLIGEVVKGPKGVEFV